MTEMLRIGDFAALSRLSVKALRFYDATGLLVPAAIADGSRYRLYDRRQLIRARQILDWKQLGLSLAEIAVLLGEADNVPGGGAGDPLERAVLEEAQERLERVIAARSCELAAITARLDRLDARGAGAAAAPALGIRVAIRRQASLLVASVRDRLGAAADAAELFREIGAGPGPAGGVRGVLWHGCGHGEDDPLEAEAFVAVPRGARTRGRVRVLELPAVMAACAHTRDDDVDAERGYDALREWLDAQGRTLAAPKRELYPMPRPGTTRPLPIEIQFPVSPA